MAKGIRDESTVDEFCRSLDRLVSVRIDPLAVDRAAKLDPEFLAELAELGAFSISIPEEFGGADLGLGGACAVVETLARHDRAVATTVGLHAGLGTRGLVAFGAREQQERWLPDLAAGATIGAFATTEPGAGSDLSTLATRAVPSEGGIRVDGEKIYVTNGGIARVFTITASTPELGNAGRGQSLVLLERGDEGLEVGPEEHKLGLRGSSTTSLYLDGVRLPIDRIVGEPGQGQRQLRHVLAWGRTVMAAGCLGTARRALEQAIEYVANRRQFGALLLEHPVVRLQLADARARIFAMRALVGEVCEVEDDRDALERISLSAKVFCSEADWEVCDVALQLQGGSGYIEETGAALPLRDARITRIFEGANDVLLGRIGAGEVIRVRERRAESLGPVAERLESELIGLCGSTRQRFGLKVMRDGRRLHRIGQIAVLVDATCAAVRRAKATSSELDAALADHWAEIAFSQAAALHARPPSDETTEAIVEASTTESTR